MLVDQHIAIWTWLLINSAEFESLNARYKCEIYLYPLSAAWAYSQMLQRTLTGAIVYAKNDESIKWYIVTKKKSNIPTLRIRDGQTGSARIWCIVEPGGAHMRVMFQPACLVTLFHFPVVRSSALNKDNILCTINKDVGDVVTEATYTMSSKYIILDALPKLGRSPSGMGGLAGNSISLVVP